MSPHDETLSGWWRVGFEDYIPEYGSVFEQLRHVLPDPPFLLTCTGGFRRVWPPFTPPLPTASGWYYCPFPS